MRDSRLSAVHSAAPARSNAVCRVALCRFCFCSSSVVLPRQLLTGDISSPATLLAAGPSISSATPTAVAPLICLLSFYIISSSIATLFFPSLFFLFHMHLGLRLSLRSATIYRDGPPYNNSYNNNLRQ